MACAATLLATPLGFGVAYLLVYSRIPGKAMSRVSSICPWSCRRWSSAICCWCFSAARLDRAAAAAFRYPDHLYPDRGDHRLGGGRFSPPGPLHPPGHGAIDRHCLQAARTLGASCWDAFFTITLPLSGRAVFAGMTLMFARSLGEFGATIILAGNIPGVTQTIPLAIYEYTSSPGGDRMALTLCLVSILLSFVVLLVSGAASRSLQRK